MLPGKLCIGILEEDNPLKAYFRIKPLLVERDGRYEVYDGGETYPEEGCIRIVPDKNESSRFKARMRLMGRYCVLDLRDHAGENDKIRPNKNYHGDETERNAHIVYSDVVREPAENMIFEVVDELAPGEWTRPKPGTPRLLGPDSPETWRYSPADEDSASARVDRDGESLAEEELQRFEIDGFRGEKLRFAIRVPGAMPSVTGTPRLRLERVLIPFSAQRGVPERRFGQPVISAHSALLAHAIAREPAPAPVSPVSPVSPVPSVSPVPPVAAVAPEPIHDAAAPQPAENPQPQPDKPWISREFPPTPPPRGRITNLQQSLEAQSGLNPRRSRSLQEVIEEKWRHSRLDQLGHQVPATATGQPVENPLERAMNALRDAWQMPDIRDELLTSIANMEEFSDAMGVVVRRERDGALRRDLEELEAERLRTMDELDKLRRSKKDLRETFKKEIREEEEEAFRDATERTRAAREECARQQAAAEEARRATAQAEDFLASLNDGRFEEKLRDFAYTSRAVEILSQPKRPSAAGEVIDDTPLTAAQWIERTRRAFAAEGLEIDAAHAANLLICLALTNMLMLSGTASSDKDATARALVRALGAYKPGRYLEISGKTDTGALLQPSPLPRVAIIRGANTRPGAEVDRGLCCASKDLIVIANLNDSNSGYPIGAEPLEHCFMVRLEPISADAPWRPATRPNEELFSPVRLDSLRAAFLTSDAEMPAGLERRLQRLRDALAKDGVRLSRQTLDLMWHYCAAMIQLNKISAGEALDLAFAQKALPCILAEAPVDCLINLRQLLAGMPHCLALLDAPLPIQI